MEIGKFNFVKKFAFLPKKLVPFDMRNGNRYKYIFVWLTYYYEVQRYLYVTWAVPPRIGWSFDGYATSKMKKDIIKNKDSFPLYGKYDKLLKNDTEMEEQKEIHRKQYEIKVKEYSEDRWLQGLVAGLKNSR